MTALGEPVPAETAPAKRLMALTDTVDWAGHRYHVSIGFDESGAAREISAAPLFGVKSLTEEQALRPWIADSCLLVSALLQSGRRADDLRLGLAFHPSSFIGRALDAAIRVERENGAIIREAHALDRRGAP